MQQKVGADGLLEGRSKRVDQLVGKVTDKSHGIRQHHRATIGYFKAPQCRVQRCEKLVSRVCTGFGQAVEKCRFAGVGIPHEGHGRDIRPLPGTAPLRALLFHLRQPRRNRLDARSE